MDHALLGPGAVTLIQTTFLQHMLVMLHVVAGYAINLLYIFAALELVVFGLAWAFARETNFGRLFFKVIKIALIFMIIRNYAYFQNIIIQSLAQVGGILAHTKGIEVLIFDPAKIWQYGYDIGLFLLKLAVTSSNIGLALIQIILGFGILLVFGLLIIQIIIQLVGFYLVTLTALVFMPFGIFSPATGMFDQTVRSVLKAGVRVMVVIFIIGVAITVWQGLNLLQIAGDPQKINMNQILGLFFSGLLFLYAAIKLPKLAANAVGKINSRTASESNIPPVTVTRGFEPTPAALFGGLANTQAAATMSPAAVQPLSTFGGAGATATQVTAAVSPQAAPPSGAAGLAPTRAARGGMIDASAISKSISDAALKKIQKTISQAIEKKS